MSRHVKRTRVEGKEVTVEYGFEKRPSPGYFYQIFELGEGTPFEGGDTRKNCVLYPERHMNRSEIVSRLKEVGVEKEHIEKMAMDFEI